MRRSGGGEFEEMGEGGGLGWPGRGVGGYAYVRYKSFWGGGRRG